MDDDRCRNCLCDDESTAGGVSSSGGFKGEYLGGVGA